MYSVELVIASFLKYFKATSLQKVLLMNFINTLKYLLEFCIFVDSLLIVSCVLGTLRKELVIDPFIERFKTTTLKKSYLQILSVLGTIC